MPIEKYKDMLNAAIDRIGRNTANDIFRRDPKLNPKDVKLPYARREKIFDAALRAVSNLPGNDASEMMLRTLEASESMLGTLDAIDITITDHYAELQYQAGYRVFKLDKGWVILTPGEVHPVFDKMLHDNPSIQVLPKAELQRREDAKVQAMEAGDNFSAVMQAAEKSVMQGSH